MWYVGVGYVIVVCCGCWIQNIGICVREVWYWLLGVVVCGLGVGLVVVRGGMGLIR